jgi:hypothetical protein
MKRVSWECVLAMSNLQNAGVNADFFVTLNARLKAVLFHGGANIVVALIRSVPLKNAETESFGTKGIPPLRVGMTRNPSFSVA